MPGVPRYPQPKKWLWILCGYLYQLREGVDVMRVTFVCTLVGVCSRLTRAAILASSPLQCLQAARRLDGSYHAPPSATGCMWSTESATLAQPGSPIWQVLLSLASICLRMVRHCPRYTGFAPL